MEFTKKLENRIRRILSILAAGSAVITLILIPTGCYHVSAMITLSLITLFLAYVDMVTELQKGGALQKKRRFWE